MNIIEIQIDNTVFLIDVLISGSTTSITPKGLANLMECINFTYTKISSTSANSRLQKATDLTTLITDSILPIKYALTNKFAFQIVKNGNILVAINPRFEYNFYDFSLRIGVRNDSLSWPKYLQAYFDPPGVGNRILVANRNANPAISFRNDFRIDSEKRESCCIKHSEILPESKGLIRYTPEFNVNTQFDNANFFRAQNDNFTKYVNQFVNAPSFNKALFIRPKLIKKKCHCKKNKNKEIIPSTTANDLQNMVVEIFQTALQIQIGEISWEVGNEKILTSVESMDKYLVKGARSIFFLNYDDELISLFFCRRYNLPNSDCVVGFSLDGIDDFDYDDRKDVIMSVSEVPIDEDMSEAIYSPIVGIFAYENTIEP